MFQTIKVIGENRIAHVVVPIVTKSLTKIIHNKFYKGKQNDNQKLENKLTKIWGGMVPVLYVMAVHHSNEIANIS